MSLNPWILVLFTFLSSFSGACNDSGIDEPGLGPGQEGLILFNGFENGTYTPAGAPAAWENNGNGGIPPIGNETRNPRTGTYSKKFDFKAYNDPDNQNAPHAWAELRFDLGRAYSELWIEYFIYVPEGTESWTTAPYHHRVASNNNHKFFYIWDSGTWDGPSAGVSDRLYYGLELRNGSGDNISNGADQDFGAAAGTEPAEPTPPAGIFRSSDLGTWVRFRWHVKASSGTGIPDGALEFWKNDTKLINETGIVWYDPGHTGFQNGMFMGWANQGFNALTTMYLDDVSFYNSNPGW